MMLRRRRGRPLGEVAVAFLQAVPALPAPTVASVAQRIGLRYASARRLATELRDGGWLRFSERTVSTATRPAAVLEVVQPEQPAQPYRGDELAGVFGLMVRSGRGR